MYVHEHMKAPTSGTIRQTPNCNLNPSIHPSLKLNVNTAERELYFSLIAINCIPHICGFRLNISADAVGFTDENCAKGKNRTAAPSTYTCEAHRAASTSETSVSVPDVD